MNLRLQKALKNLKELTELVSRDFEEVTFDPPERTDMKNHYTFKKQVVALDLNEIVGFDEREKPIEQGRTDQFADIVLSGGAKIRVDLNTAANRDAFTRILDDWYRNGFQPTFKEAV